MRSPMRHASLPPSLGPMRRHGPAAKPRRAGATARLMSSLSLSGPLVMTEPSAGLKTSKVLPEAAETHLPAIKLHFGFASHPRSVLLTPGEVERAEPCPLAFANVSVTRLVLGR